MAEDLTRRLKIYINGTEVDATITNLRKNLTKFRAQANQAVEGTPQWKKFNQEVARTELELKQAYEAQKDFKESTKLSIKGIEENSKALTDFTGNLTQMILGLKSGNFIQFKEGFDAVKISIYGATKAALAFIATPLGAALALFTGVAAIVREWANYNAEIQDSILLTQQITKLTGEQADAIRLRNKALADTFGTEEKETLEVARNLVQQFGISYEEAFSTIEDGLIRGQKNNTEYLNSLREYPAFFAAAGFSVQEFKDIVAKGYDLGIYSDKLPDAIKEFDISMREQTKSTREALINAFGQTFTDNLLQRLNSGKTSTKTALQEVSAEAERLGLSIEQNQRLTADVFRGAGEDAGGALKVMQAISGAAQDATKALTPLEEANKNLSDANLRLAEAQDAALKSDNYISFMRDLQIFWTDLKTGFFNAIKFITDSFTSLNDFTVATIFSIVTTIQSLPDIIVKSFQDIGTSVFNTIKSFTGLGDVIDRIINLDFSGAKTAATDYKNNISKNFESIGTAAKATAKEIIATQQAAFNASLKSFENKRTGNAAAVKYEEPSALDPEEAAKRKAAAERLTLEQQEETRKATEAAIKKRQAVADAIKKFDEEQKITETLAKLEEDQRAEEEEVIRLENKFIKLREDAQGETTLLTELEKAQAFQLQQIRDKHAEIRTKKEKETQDKILAQDKAYRQESINAERNLQEARANAKLAGLGMLSNIFGKEKALGMAAFAFEKGFAIASILKGNAEANAKIGASLAIANSIAVAASPLTLGQPFVAINSANALKNTTANNINTAVQIGTIAATAIKGFDGGGETFPGTYSGGVDGKGGKYAVVHPNEYIIPAYVRKDPEVPRIIDYLEAKRTGTQTTSSDSSVIPSNNNTDAVMMALTNAVNKLVDEGVKASTIYTLNDERKRRELADKLDNTIKSSKE